MVGGRSGETGGLFGDAGEGGASFLGGNHRARVPRCYQVAGTERKWCTSNVVRPLVVRVLCATRTRYTIRFLAYPVLVSTRCF